MQSVSVSTFKNQCLELFRAVEKNHEEIIVTKHGQTIAMVVPPKNTPNYAWKKLRGTVSFDENELFEEEADVWAEVL